ncbi:hypothetical protein SLS56_008707 [Neofusicoccum ribis]|uniref:Cytochrome P450 monooxygenase n=1 Tax=Neofusicoccum ribis TaxID=45134 RepID=A0ABR3SJC9_9PEZI
MLPLILHHHHKAPHSAGQKPVPTVPFTWPNGQGTEKFFEGRKAALRWRDEFGPIYRIWSGFKPEIVLSKPEQAQRFYRDSHLHIKATDNNSGWLFGELLGQCVGLVSLHRWRNLRQEVDPPFSRPAAIAHTAMLARQARDFVAERFLSSLPADGRTTVRPAADLKLCPFFMVAEIFFGRLDPPRRAALAALAPLREDLFKHAFRGGVNRFALGKYLPGSPVRARLAEFQDRWHAFVRDAYAKAVAEQQAAGAPPPPPVVQLWEAVERGQIPMVEFMQTLDESLYANLDVTTHAVAWNVILIAQHPPVQDEVLAEIRAAAGGGDESAYVRYLNSDDTLLAACVVEAARLRPILPFSNPESATDDKIIDHYVIPRGTDVIVDTHAINVANPFWKDGEKYMPRRHIGLSKQQIRYNMWRYGFGPRQCLGKNVADRLIRAIIAEILPHFELRLPVVSKTSDQDFSLEDESWVGLPSTKVIFTKLE